MNGSELPHSDDNAPQTSRSESRPLFLESIFLGPHGVRAGWRAALYVALFLLFLSTAGMAGGLLHFTALAPGGTITPAVLAPQGGLAAICASASGLIPRRRDARRQ